MEVSIYINSYHRGHLSKGTGKYGIILEYIRQNGLPHTTEIFEGMKPTTRNKVALQSCLLALSKLNMQCEVTLYINNTYITETINQEWYLKWDREKWINRGKTIPNVEEWQQLFSEMEKHNITFEFKENSSYTSYIETMLKHIEVRED